MSDTDSEDVDYDDLWILKFNRNKEHMFLERIPDSFIEDRFNFYNMKEQIEDFKECYQAILDQGPSMNFIEECKMFYYIHQRYIVFNKTGQNNILDKIKNKVFYLQKSLK